MSGQPEPNRRQAELWNSMAGDAWVEMQDVLDRLFAAVGDRLVEAGFPGTGGRVLDIGCGAGSTTLAMAWELGPQGGCLGVDISRPLIETAARRAADAGLAGARFVAADAQTHSFERAGFDAAISRFGVMFFEDPVAGFANIRRALRPGGTLAFAAWRSPAENPFMTAATRAAAALLPELPTPAADAPGQFGLARAERISEVLDGAGWSQIEIRPLDVEACLGGEDLNRYAVRMGPVGLAMQTLDEAERAPIRDAVLRGFEPFVRDGAAHFNLACWLVTARTSEGTRA